MTVREPRAREATPGPGPAPPLWTDLFLIKPLSLCQPGSVCRAFINLRTPSRAPQLSHGTPPACANRAAVTVSQSLSPGTVTVTVTVGHHASLRVVPNRSECHRDGDSVGPGRTPRPASGNNSGRRQPGFTCCAVNGKPPGRRWILGEGRRVGGPGRPPCWRTLKESRNLTEGLGPVSLN